MYLFVPRNRVDAIFGQMSFRLTIAPKKAIRRPCVVFRYLPKNDRNDQKSKCKARKKGQHYQRCNGKHSGKGSWPRERGWGNKMENQCRWPLAPGTSWNVGFVALRLSLIFIT